MAPPSLPGPLPAGRSTDYRRFGQTKRSSVGRAHPGYRLNVVDPTTGASLPLGATGVLEVQSSRAGDHAAWVRTTDIAAIDEDGFLWIKGRADGVITRGGFKIWPADVQRVLETHPGVREAAVFAIEDPRLGQVPAAAVERSEVGGGLTNEQLQAHCRQHLTGYQTPVRFLIVDVMPRTSSMKVAEGELRAQLERDEGVSS